MAIALCASSWLRRLARALGRAIASVVDFVFLLRASAIRKRTFMAFGLALVLLSLMASCCVSRQATREVRSLTTELRSTETRDSVTIELRDTLREITTITIDRNDRGDTLRVKQITDRTRAHEKSGVRSRKEEVLVRIDTVYIEKRDSVLAERHRSSAVSHPTSILKWTFAIVCAIIVLIIVVKKGSLL